MKHAALFMGRADTKYGFNLSAFFAGRAFG